MFTLFQTDAINSYFVYLKTEFICVNKLSSLCLYMCVYISKMCLFS